MATAPVNGENSSWHPSLESNEFLAVDDVETLTFWLRAVQGELRHERESAADVRRLLDDFQRQYSRQRRQFQEATTALRHARKDEADLREHLAVLAAENEELHMRCSNISLKLSYSRAEAEKSELLKSEEATVAKEQAQQEAACYASELAISKVKLATLMEEQDRLGKLVLFYASHIADCCPSLLVSPRDQKRIEALDFECTAAPGSKTNSIHRGAAYSLLKAIGLSHGSGGNFSHDGGAVPSSVRSLPTRQQTVLSARLKAAAATPPNKGRMQVGWRRPPLRPPRQQQPSQCIEDEEAERQDLQDEHLCSKCPSVVDSTPAVSQTPFLVTRKNSYKTKPVVYLKGSRSKLVGLIRGSSSSLGRSNNNINKELDDDQTSLSPAQQQTSSTRDLTVIPIGSAREEEAHSPEQSLETRSDPGSPQETGRQSRDSLMTPLKTRPFLPPLPLDALHRGRSSGTLSYATLHHQHDQHVKNQQKQRRATSGGASKSRKWYKKLGDLTSKYTGTPSKSHETSSKEAQLPSSVLAAHNKFGACRVTEGIFEDLAN